MTCALVICQSGPVGGNGGLCGDQADLPDGTVLARHISLLARTQRRVIALTRKVEDLQRKLADQKIIFRGKLVLMGHLDISEEAAHRCLQKKAMDLRMKPAEVAERIITTVTHKHSW